MTRTMSPREARRPLDERPRGEEHEEQHEEQLDQEQEAPTQPLPGRVRLDVGDEPLPEQRRRDRCAVAPQLEQVHREDGREETRPSSASGEMNGIAGIRPA